MHCCIVRVPFRNGICSGCLGPQILDYHELICHAAYPGQNSNKACKIVFGSAMLGNNIYVKKAEGAYLIKSGSDVFLAEI